MFASKLRSALIYLSGAALMLGMGSAAANDWPLNLRQGVTTISQQVFDLHMLIFWICVVACVLVFAVLIYSIMTHRKSKGAVPATFHESTTVEIIWTTIPFLVLVGMAVPATKALLALEDTRNADMSIKVTGYQWKWKYEYLDGEAEGISFMSNLDEKSNEIRQMNSGLDPADHEHYLLYVDNPGSAASDVSLQDTLAAEFAYVSGSLRYDNSVASCAARRLRRIHPPTASPVP